MRHLIIALALLITGCGFSPVTTALSPRIDVPEAEVGNGRSIRLVVRDDRADPALGERRHGLVRGSQILPSEPVDAVVRRTLEAALGRRGFRILSDGPADGELRVAIKALRYVPEGGAFGARATTEVRIEAEAEAAGGSHRGSYAVADSDRLAIATSEHFSAERMSAMLGEALRRLVSDPELMAVLAPR